MKKTIAVIDDDTSLLEILKKVLENEGYKVKTYSHTVFINLLDQESYDLALIDVWFHTTRAGIAMAQAILNNQRLQPQNIIMMSSDSSLEEYALKAGVTNYVSKPINFKALLEIIENLDTSAIKQPSQATVTYSQNPAQI